MRCGERELSLVSVSRVRVGVDSFRCHAIDTHDDYS
jgi:hypothetical protein